MRILALAVSVCMTVLGHGAVLNLTGLEDRPVGELNLVVPDSHDETNLFFCADSAGDLSCAVVAYGDTDGYDGRAGYPVGFDGCGKQYLNFKTGFKSPLYRSVNPVSDGMVGRSYELTDRQPVCFDCLVKLTVFDEEPEWTVEQNSVSLLRLAVRRAGGYLTVDDAVRLFFLERYDENDEPVATNLCVQIRCKNNAGTYETKTCPTSVDGISYNQMDWHRVTICRGRSNIALWLDGERIAEFFRDGSGGAGGTPIGGLSYPSVDECTRYISFVGTGSLDDLSISTVEPSFRQDAGSVMVNKVLWTYSVSNGQSRVERADVPPDCGEVRVPDAFACCPVVEICGGAFAYCMNLIKIDFPESVEYIGGGFREVVTNITDYGSGGNGGGVLPCSGGTATSIETITIMYDVERECFGAFEGCSNLKTVIFPRGLQVLSNGAFYKCSGLESVVIPESVCSLGASIEKCSVRRIITGSGSGGSGSSALPSTSGGTVTTTTTEYGIETTDAIERAAYVHGVFEGCSNLTSVILHEGLETIGDAAFRGCGKLASIDIPDSVKTIGVSAFAGCSALTTVEIPAGVDTIAPILFSDCTGLDSVWVKGTRVSFGARAFEGCSELMDVYYDGRLKNCGEDLFKGTPEGLVFHVTLNWLGNADELQGRLMLKHDSAGEIDMPSWHPDAIHLTVSNVIVHYVNTSTVPSLALPVSMDTGFVTVVTEIKGGAVSISPEWAANYPGFEQKFGSDFGKALTKATGKCDGQGNALCVWQDYVAGTDPTDETDVFKASITMVDGKPLVSFTPELKPEQAALRKYTKYGKVRLQDAEWSEITDDQASDYNFFRVTVEMR